jgi:glycerol transport system substrate-binding protein
VPSTPAARKARTPVEEGGHGRHGHTTPHAAMDNLAEEMDQVRARLQRAGMARCAPKVNPKCDPSKWLSSEHALWKLDNEKPKGETIAHDKPL